VDGATGLHADDPRAATLDRFSRRIAEALAEAWSDLAPEEPTHHADQLLSVTEAAQRLGIARATAYLLITSGDLRSVKIRKRRLVPASDVARLIAAGSRRR
jgi:excisionase family DNA binding protein